MPVPAVERNGRQTRKFAIRKGQLPDVPGIAMRQHDASTLLHQCVLILPCTGSAENKRAAVRCKTRRGERTKDSGGHQLARVAAVERASIRLWDQLSGSTRR